MKLAFSFFIPAVLVLLSGVVGIIILNKVARSADTIVRGKVPTQHAVMKANHTVKTIQNSKNLSTICRNLSANSNYKGMTVSTLLAATIPF